MLKIIIFLKNLQTYVYILKMMCYNDNVINYLKGDVIKAMQELTPKASQILQFLEEGVANGLSPTVREIGLSLGIKSTSTVHKYLNELRDKGYIKKEDGLKRTIRFTDSFVNSSGLGGVPIMGTVTAGMPILAVENITGYLPIEVKGCDPKELFALNVRGESMINVGIYDGDTIIVKRTPVADNGDIVVALIDDSATVKTFYKEDGHFRLQPENDTMEPIIVESVAILGRVVKLVRDY